MAMQKVLPGYETQELSNGSVTPMAILARALEKDASVETLAKLMDLHERWERNEAQKAFVEALAKFKANPPRLEKNKEVDFTTKAGGRVKYKHATLDYVAETLGRELSKYGLSFRWQTQQEGGKIRVTCFLQHQMGHGESVSMEAPADDSGQKNAIQQIGSTVTYLERYTLLAATGMATADQDNDGALTNGEVLEQVNWIKCAKDLEELGKLYKNAMRSALEHKNYNAIKVYDQARDERKAELCA